MDGTWFRIALFTRFIMSFFFLVSYTLFVMFSRGVLPFFGTLSSILIYHTLFFTSVSI